jgi:hypothetical protein
MIIDTMFEQLELQHSQVYGDFRKQGRGTCGCRSGEENSYVIRQG